MLFCPSVRRITKHNVKNKTHDSCKCTFCVQSIFFTIVRQKHWQNRGVVNLVERRRKRVSKSRHGGNCRTCWHPGGRVGVGLYRIWDTVCVSVRMCTSEKHLEPSTWTLKRGCVCVCVCPSACCGVCLKIYLSVHVFASLYLWLFSGCTPPVYTMSTLRESSSETLMLIDPSEDVWTQVCCRRLWVWHGCQGILGNRGAYRARAENATSQGTSDPVLF